MEPLVIEATFDTPRVLLDKEQEKFEITQRSMPEDAVKFFAPIIEWFNKYIENPNPKTHFRFFFEYFSTNSAKQIARLMYLLEKLSEQSEVKIIWQYAADDIDMKNAGHRYSQIIELNISVEAVNTGI